MNPEAGEALDSKIDETLEAGDKVIKDVMDPINEAGEAAEDKLSEWINKGVNTVEKELETGGNTEIPASGDTTQNTPSLDNNVSSGNDWTTDNANALSHWEKHKGEFTEYQNAEDYVNGVNEFLNKPPSGTLSKTRDNGDTLLYNPQSNIFAVKNKNGVPRTMFKPEGGMKYWNRQK